MSIEIELLLTIAGMIIFFNAGEYEARDGSANHKMLWAFLSFLVSVLILFTDLGVIGWVLGQAVLFVGIGAVRAWLEDHANK